MSITSVWSAFGHRFASTDSDEHNACLTCGALYALIATPGGPNDGAYVTAAGDEPARCTGDTSMVHGYPGERVCGSCDGSGCPSCEHSCNCLSCDS